VDADRLMTRLNPLVAGLLRSPLHSLASRWLLVLTVTGRRSGRRYAIPVGYQRDGDRLVVLVSNARRKRWWRNYRSPGPVELLLRGRPRRGVAELVPPGSDAFRRAFEASFRRLPGLARQFGIAYARGSALTPAQSEALAADAAVVHIALAAQ
jgi:F420H(2)-dependent quinone reductase